MRTRTIGAFTRSPTLAMPAAREHAAKVMAYNRTVGSSTNIVGMLAAEAGMEIGARRPQASEAAAQNRLDLEALRDSAARLQKNLFPPSPSPTPAGARPVDE